MYISGNASSFRSMLRGGAVSEESLPAATPDGAQSSGSFNASSVDMLSDMSDMIRPLSQDEFQGDIDGEAHTAAKTCGDGTCALHALFGLPVRGELYASGVREVLANCLKEDLSSMMACLPSLGSKALLSEVLKTVWRELKDVADRSSQNQDADIDGRHLWKCCPDDVKESLLGLSRSRQLERDQQTRREEKTLRSKPMQQILLLQIYPEMRYLWQEYITSWIKWPVLQKQLRPKQKQLKKMDRTKRICKRWPDQNK